MYTVAKLLEDLKGFPTDARIRPATRKEQINGVIFVAYSDGFYKGSREWEFGDFEDDEEEEDFEEDYDLEMGFDPYMGCYTEDC